MHQPSKKLLYMHSNLLLDSEAQVMLLKCKAGHIIFLLNLPSCFHLAQSTQHSTTWLQLASALAALSSSRVPCSSRLRAFAHPSFPFPFHGITACSSCRSQLRYHFLWEAVSHAPDELKFLARCYSPAPSGLFPPIKLITTIITWLFIYLTSVLAAPVVCKPHKSRSVYFGCCPLSLSFSFFKFHWSIVALRFPGVKNPSANAGDARDVGLIPGLGRYPGV